MKGAREQVEVVICGGRQDGYRCVMDRRLVEKQTFVLPVDGTLVRPLPKKILADVYKLAWLKGGVAGYVHHVRTMVDSKKVEWLPI